MKKQQIGGFGFYFIILILMAFIWYFISTLGMSNADYKYNDFAQDLKEGNVKEVVIVPSQYVPTGTLEITLYDKKAKIDRLHRINLFKLRLMPCFEPNIS